MTDDPIVAEIRAIREAYARRFNYDIDAIGRDLQERQRQSGEPTVTLPPRRIEKPATDDCEVEVEGPS